MRSMQTLVALAIALACGWAMGANVSVIVEGQIKPGVYGRVEVGYRFTCTCRRAMQGTGAGIAIATRPAAIRCISSNRWSTNRITAASTSTAEITATSVTKVATEAGGSQTSPRGLAVADAVRLDQQHRARANRRIRRYGAQAPQTLMRGPESPSHQMEALA